VESTELRMFFKALSAESPTLRMLRDDPSQLKRRFGLTDSEIQALSNSDMGRASTAGPSSTFRITQAEQGTSAPPSAAPQPSLTLWPSQPSSAPTPGSPRHPTPGQPLFPPSPVPTALAAPAPPIPPVAPTPLSACGCCCCASVVGMVSVVSTTATTAIAAITAIAGLPCSTTETRP
jgi:hypothetical protein